jgi:hypothetical protein
VDLTLREILDRYGPTIGLIVALVLLVAIFPNSKTTRVESEIASTESGTAVEAAGAAEGITGTTGAKGAGKTSTSGAGTVAGPVTGGSGKIASAPGAVTGKKICRADGRQLGISRYLPPCVALFSGNNGGETAKGVHADSITIVRYMAQVNAATQAALIAAGADDDREDQDRMDAALVDYFNWHYETYGREVKIITMDATGESSNDSAMRADAKTIADKHKAFAVWGAPDTLAEELSARGVICICTTSLSDRFYAEHRDHIFSSLPSAEEYTTATAEYIGKRLNGRVAKNAGTGISAMKRKFGIVYLEATTSGPRRHAKEVRDQFLNELKKYGVTNVKTVGYSSDLTQSQEQSTNVISQLRDAGVTSVALLADPLFPIFLTKEATKQAFFPEWIIMGTALTDTTFFGRTYDQAQWAHAFGISPLWVFWVDVSGSAGYREYHHARPGSNRGDEGVSINVRRSPIQWLFQGIHMAGPNLTPKTFAQGMYNYPRTGGVPDAPLVFFTAARPNAIKDFTEVWWNTTGSGRDETGKDGPGALMKVDGGKRYLTGTWPRTEPKVFVDEGAVYTKDLPQPKHEQDGHKHDPKQRCLSCK